MLNKIFSSFHTGFTWRLEGVPNWKLTSENQHTFNGI